MADNNIDVKLLLDTKKATESVANFTDQLKALAVAAAAAFAGAKVAEFLSDIVKESSLAEEAVSGFNNALALSGNFSAEASKDFQEYAASIQATTKYSDEAVLSTGALLEQMTGLDEGGLKQATSAALDLSAALRIDLDSATRLVGKAAEGNISAFKRYGIEIQKGNSDAETFANTLQTLSTRFGGVAAAQANTFSGAMAILGNAISDVKEALGDIITKNPAVITGIQTLTKIFQILGKFILDNRDSIIEFIRDGIINFLKFIPSIVEGIGFINDAFFNLGGFINTAKEKFAKFTSFAAFGIAFIKGENAGILKSIIDNSKAESAAAKKAADDAKISYDTRTSVINDFKFATQGVIDQTIEQIKLDKKRTEEIENQSKAVKQLSDDEIKANISKLGANPALGLLSSETAAFSGIKGGASAAQQTQQNIAAGVGVINSALQGMSGAVKLASGLVSGIAEKLLPGIGAVAGQIFEVLAQGPEKVRAMITQFIQAIPTIITNIVASIPAAIEAILAALPTLVSGLIFAIIEQIPNIIFSFIENLPLLVEGFFEGLSSIFDRLIERAPELIAKLISEIPNFMIALQLQLPMIAAQFAISLASQAPFIAISFATEFIKQIPRIVAEIANGVKNAIAGIAGGGVKSVASAGGGVLSSVKKIFGFAEGGLVGPGFPNDSALARLSSGEFVVNNDLTQKLTDFLSGKNTQAGGSQNLTVNLVIGESQLAQAILNLNQKGFRLA